MAEAKAKKTCEACGGQKLPVKVTADKEVRPSLKAKPVKNGPQWGYGR